MSRRTYFSDLWLKLPQYKDWLRKKDDITWKCSYCAKDIDVSNTGESPLKSHAERIKHRSRSPTEPNPLSFFDGSKNEKNKEMSANSGQKTITFTKTKLKLKIRTITFSTFTRVNVSFAEIRCALKTVESNYSQRSCENTNELFKIMFPGSIVAEHSKLGKTKCGYLITHGLRNCFLGILIQKYNNHLSILFLLTKV